MTIFTEIDDTGSKFRAALPVAVAPAKLPQGGLAVAQAPAGKTFKFAHVG